jgi:O-acetyl-ADP-ribose deacetylase (regulator of RNase III)
MSFPGRERSHSLPLTSTPAPDPLHTSRPKVTPVVDSLLPPNYSNLHLPIHTSAGHSDIDISQILANVGVPTSSVGTGPKIPDAPYMDEIGDLDPGALYLMKKLGMCQMTGITLNCGIGSVTLSASREQGLDEMRNMFLTSYSELHPPLVKEIKYNMLDDTDVLQSFAAECDNKYKNTAFWMDRKSKVLRLASNKETELERAHKQLSSHVTAHQVERYKFYGDHYLSKSEKPLATTAVGLPAATAPPPTTRTATFTVDSLVLQPAKVPLGTPSIFEAAANPQERPDGSAHTSIPPSSGGLVDPRVAHHHKTTQGQLRVSGSGSEASFTTAGGSPLDHPHTHSHISRSSQKDKSPSSEEMMLLNDGRVTLRLKKGNIVEEAVDVIVNAANSHLKHLGGVAADLNEASEGVLQVLSDDYVQSKGPVSVGGVCGTQAGGRLKCSFVFHAVGPKAGEQDKDKTEKLLKSVCINALKLAESNQVKTIAFPAISAGIFGVDVDIVSRMLIKSLSEYPYAPTSSVKEVRLVIYPEDTFEHFLGYFRRKRNHLMKKGRGVSPGRVPSRVPSGSSDPSKVKTSSRSSQDMKLLGNLGNVGDPKNIRLQSEEKKPWK